MGAEKPSSRLYELLIADEVKSWLHDLRRDDPKLLRAVSEAVTALRREGPGLGRPLVDRLEGTLPHMKELRPTMSTRILFAFDPKRRAVLLVAGDKRDRWQSWYREAIPLAEERYARHLKAMTEEDKR
ncbi:type II toxin-antitoxin system RelE/ParE family toxin [Kitasatospora sp. GAS204B]|uniref:type II toxin-antitoxin system RelE/ParE family toxin n=1 Tax=unclassified Kitasatospora TaxID=2633591 RepID=UPI002476444C|nr:type II toxin-antitoxin system RelE/ParE family toxin [Kitasatospora sp. GAS204B]MDH6118272.1 hypothetical protein [Kitasatospora sp. GAS204B]